MVVIGTQYQLENAIKSGGTVFLLISLGLNSLPGSCDIAMVLNCSKNYYTQPDFGVLGFVLLKLFYQYNQYLMNMPQKFQPVQIISRKNNIGRYINAMFF